MGVGNKNNDSDMGGELCLRKRQQNCLWQQPSQH